MKLVAFSDAHGDATTAGLDRHDDVAEAVTDVVAAAIREKADLVLFLGDLTDPDTSRSHRAVAMLAGAARELRAHRIDFMAIVGNHDVIEDGRGTSTLSPIAASGFRVCSSPAIVPWTWGAVVALPYPPRSASHDAEAFVREQGPRLLSSMRGDVNPHAPVVVAGHLMIRGADPGSESAELARGRDVFFPSDACREIFGRHALLLNGHYHRRQVAPGGIQVPGSLARLRFDEERHEPVFLVCEIKGGAWNVEFRRIEARQLVTIGAKDSIWTDGFPIRERSIVPGAIVRLRPPAGAPDELVARVKAALERESLPSAVRVEPRAAGAKVVAPERAPVAPVPARSPRAVAMEMAGEARTRDRAALVETVDRELAAQKL